MNLHPNSENLGIRTDDLELSAGSAVKRKVKLPDNLSKGIINWNKLFYCFNQLLKRKLWTWMQRQLPINPITAKFNELRSTFHPNFFFYGFLSRRYAAAPLLRCYKRNESDQKQKNNRGYSTATDISRAMQKREN